MKRPDEIETLLKSDEIKSELLRGLTIELREEYKGYKILDIILRKRIHKTIHKLINDESATESELDITSISKEWFDSQVDNYYLQRREELEKATFLIFRSKVKGIVLEGEQRMRNNEETWKDLSDRWGSKPEQDTGGLCKNMSINQVPTEITKELQRLSVNEISQPFRIGPFYAITKLIGWKSVELNEQLREALAQEMFAKWIDNITGELIN